jgi:hypothetical protein
MKNARRPEGQTSAREQGDSRTGAAFLGTDNPRHLRVIQAVKVRPVPREELDQLLAECVQFGKAVGTPAERAS